MSGGAVASTDAALHVELLRRAAMEGPKSYELSNGLVVAFSGPRPTRTPNQDAALLLEFDGALVLAVADGMGGARGGARAATLAVETLRDTVASGEASLRERILQGFELANRAIRRMRVGAGATLVVATIVGEELRLFHAGDAQALVVGQRGAVKALTRSHSPVGYAVAAGVLSFDEALHHSALHLVANGLGNPELMIEMSSPFRLAARDTLLLASDGLFDNLYLQEVIELIRRGRLTKVGKGLLKQVADRMAAAFQPPPFSASSAEASEVDQANSWITTVETQSEALEPPESRLIEEAAEPLPLPSKPDDLTFLLYRRSKR